MSPKARREPPQAGAQDSTSAAEAIDVGRLRSAIARAHAAKPDQASCALSYTVISLTLLAAFWWFAVMPLFENALGWTETTCQFTGPMVVSARSLRTRNGLFQYVLCAPVLVHPDGAGARHPANASRYGSSGDCVDATDIATMADPDPDVTLRWLLHSVPGVGVPRKERVWAGRLRPVRVDKYTVATSEVGERPCWVHPASRDRVRLDNSATVRGSATRTATSFAAVLLLAALVVCWCGCRCCVYNWCRDVRVHHDFLYGRETWPLQRCTGNLGLY